MTSLHKTLKFAPAIYVPMADEKAEAKPEAAESKEAPKTKPDDTAKPDTPEPAKADGRAESDDKKPEPVEEKPKPKEYTKEEIEEIAKRVETPSDQTPPYRPDNVLSPEYGGTSNYEMGLSEATGEARDRLARLQADPGSSQAEIDLAEENLKKLEYLYENYNIGMNVFRVAKGGRDKLRE